MTAPRLRLLTSHRLEMLVEDLARRLREQPLSPLQRETIVVPSRGMGRWVNVQLARAHGIAASIDFPFAFTWARTTLQTLGFSPPRERDAATVDPFEAGALQWRVFETLGRLEALDATGSDVAPLRAYLDDDEDLRKRGQLAARLASVFAGYQLQRPWGLRRWERGAWFDDRPDAAAGEVWQAALWRALVRETPVPPLSTALLEACVALSDARPATMDRIARVEVFGVTTLPPVILDLLGVLGRHVPVTVSFVSPARGYWADLPIQKVVPTSGRLEPGDVELPLREHEERGHPLLASWGRLARDFHRLVLERDESGELEELSDDDTPTSLLGRLQRDVLDVVDPSADGFAARPADPDDRSLRVHLCHSELRELEVLRDEILRAFEDLVDLRASDVLLLVPDLERYAPFVRAVFGRALGDDRVDVDAAGSPGRWPLRLPVRIADGPGVQGQPFARLLLELLRLPDARLHASEILALFEIEAFARRFGLSPDDLPALRDLVRAAGVRWGEDPRRRAARLGLPEYEGGSWREGIDRLLLGFATGQDEALVEGLLPVADATTGRAELIARLATAIETAFDVLGDLRAPRSITRWAAALRSALLALTEVESEREAEQRRDVLERIDALEQIAREFSLDADVGRSTLRETLERALDDDAAGRGFVSGSITVAELRPMRSVPYRVIAVAGLGDGFPRQDPPPGFDLVARHPRAGDRTPRLDDRQLFLEALLSARDRVVLSAVGRSVRDNQARARSVCIDELLEVIDRSFVGPAGAEPSSWSVVEHRLQPFDRCYVSSSSREHFTYDPQMAAAAASAQAAPASRRVPTLVDTTFPGSVGDAPLRVELGELERFWRDPSAWFVRERMRLWSRRDERDLDEEPFAIGSLDAWRLREEVWTSVRRGVPVDGAAALAQRLGLPRGRFGHALTAAKVEEVRTRLAEHGVDPAAWSVHPITIEHAEFELEGTLVLDPDRWQWRVTAGSIDARLRAPAWVAHVAACASGLGVGGTKLVSSKDGGSKAVEQWAGFAREEALDALASLVAGYRAAHARPIAFFPSTSEAWWNRAASRGALTSEQILEAFLDPAVHTKWEGDGSYTKGEVEREAVELCVRGLEDREIATEDFAHWARVVFGGIADRSIEVPKKRGRR